MKKTKFSLLNKIMLTLILLFTISAFAYTAEKKAPKTKKLSEMLTLNQSSEPIPITGNISIQTITGQTQSLNSYKNKVIILNIWATWCPPCTREIPFLIELQREYGPKGLQIIGISMDENIGTVKKFVKVEGINYPIGMFNKNIETTLGAIYSIPTTFIIDKEQRIIKKIVGYHEKEAFITDIKPLL